MSNNENNNHNMELEVFENQNQILFTGYIREIKNTVSRRTIVPRHIIALCYRFFFIECMKQLQQRRETALEVKDDESVRDIEQLIFYKACRTSLNEFNQQMLDTVISNWFADKTDEYSTERYRNSIIKCATQCLWSDNVEVLKVIFRKCEYQCLFTSNKSWYSALEKRRMDEIIRFINVAIVWNACKCAKYLLEHADKLDWTNEFLPDILLNAVVHQHKNISFLEFVINQLEKNEIVFGTFKCITFKNKWDDIMEKVIESDLVNIAKRIVGKGWYNVSHNDEDFAAFLNEKCTNKCYQWFKARSNNYLDVINCNSMQIELDDSGWDTESDDSFQD